MPNNAFGRLNPRALFPALIPELTGVHTAMTNDREKEAARVNMIEQDSAEGLERLSEGPNNGDDHA
jgi:hypothetical protein